MQLTDTILDFVLNQNETSAQFRGVFFFGSLKFIAKLYPAPYGMYCILRNVIGCYRDRHTNLSTDGGNCVVCYTLDVLA